MNEQEMERLLKSYGDSFGTPKMPLTRRSPVRWRRRAGIGLAFGAVAAMGVIAIWPRNAVASTLARIHNALSNVTTMEQESYVTPPNPALNFARVYYENNMWRFDSNLGARLERSFVFRDGMQLSDWKNLDFATLQKASPQALKDIQAQGRTALDYVKDAVNTGRMDEARTISIHEHAPFEGVPTYVVSLDRPGDNYHAEILVDKRTDLPLLADIRNEGTGDRVSHWYAGFTFNKPLDPKLFSLTPAKTVINVPTAVERLGETWSHPLGRVNQTEVRQVSLEQSGTIWIASTAPSKDDTPALPTRLTDNLGNEYLRIQDVVPSAMSEDDQLTIGGKSIIVTGFVPIKPNGPLPATVSVAFSTRGGYYPGFAEPSNQEVKDLHASLSLKPILEAGEWPDYFRSLNIASYLMAIPMSEWTARAKHFDAKGDLLSASQAYGELAKARYNWVKYSAFQPMLQEARCYRALGQVEKADDLTKQANDLKVSRVR